MMCEVLAFTLLVFILFFHPRCLHSFPTRRSSDLPQWVVADIGSGTGLLTKIFLENGNRVFAVEPNAAMRAAGEEYLDRKSTRLNSSHVEISYAVFCLKKKNKSCFNYEFYNIRLNS